MSMKDAIERFLDTEDFKPQTRSEKLLAAAFKEAEEANRIFDFLRWLTEQTDGRAVPKKDFNNGKVMISDVLKDTFTGGKK